MASRLVSKGARDVIIVGGGHNALVSAAYLAKSGLDVLLLERRHVLGGAAVTEEIVPGFKFSRASYLAGLLRPAIIEDLKCVVGMKGNVLL
jgi:phytoene dehydrogenase-like protein